MPTENPPCPHEQSIRGKCCARVPACVTTTKRPCASVLVIAAIAALWANSAGAAFFCASTAAQIQTDLSVAQTNGEDDQINIAGDNYLLTSGLFYSSTELHSITIVGGWNTDCSQYIDALTTLDGLHQVRPLHVMTNAGDVNIQGLSFVGGLSTNNRGGGLNVTTMSGDIRVEGNSFYVNRADDFAGALVASSDSGTLLIRNNLIAGNSAAVFGGIELCQASGEAYVNSNTIVSNTSDDGASVGGLHTECNAHFNLSDNIIWGNNANGAADFGTTGVHSRYSNDIGTLEDGTIGDPVENELSVDPQFCTTIGCPLFDLQRNSPLVDVGLDTPPGGLAPYDLARHDRIIGPHVDIGAYENDVIFAGGFE
ncbi:MAG: hypothetical protein WB784_03810 [Rhodanobacteraceae bacterium]